MSLPRSLLFLILILQLSLVLEGASAQQERRQLTLEESYQLARAASESLLSQQTQIEIAEAQYRQSRAALLPQVTIGASQRYRSGTDYGVRQRGAAIDDPGNGNVNRGSSLGRSQSDVSLVVQQPLFSGFRDILLTRAMRRGVEASQYDLQRGSQQLLQAVAELYYEIQLYSFDIKVLQRIRALIDERITELQRFVSLGKSRESEVLAAQAERNQIEASVVNATRALTASREMFAFLLKRPAGEIELSEAREESPLLQQDEYISLSANRPDLTAAKLRIEGAEFQRKAASREAWPAVTFEGTSYLLEDPDRNRDWDALIRLQMPIFDGGRISARTEEERLKMRVAELNLQELSRQVERDVRLHYSNVTLYQTQIERLTEALRSAQRLYDAQRADYALGIVTNLDVLNALQRSQDAERQLIAAQAERSLSIVRLNVAAGVLMP